MFASQNHIPILDIKEDIVLTRDGGATLVIKTSAVNFGLLSEREQIAIIDSFAQMLNSLSFAIQIVIRSERLDISSYLQLLDKASKLQTNPLLASMMSKYRLFVQSLIKEREVLDKQFYITLPLASYEIGVVVKNNEERLKKAKVILLPRRDQVIKQLSRIGLKATQLNTEQLIKLFYNIYNQTNIEISQAQPIQPVNLLQPQNIRPNTSINATPTSNLQPPTSTPTATRTNTSHPFVVEELHDNI